MNHFVPAQSSQKSWHAKALTAVVGLSLAFQAVSPAVAQTATAKAPVKVSLTQAAFLPAESNSRSRTSIATDLGGPGSVASPWRISLVHLDRTDEARYTISVTNSSSKALTLPISTDGDAIWSSCRKTQIAEIDFSLTISGQPIPAANLPSAHSCSAIRSSFAIVQPGASVTFQGTLSRPLPAKAGVGVSALVSVCSASYNPGLAPPVTVRHCGAPSVSHSITE